MSIKELQQRTKNWAKGENIDFTEYSDLRKYERKVGAHFVSYRKFVDGVYIRGTHARYELLLDELTSR